MFKKITPVINVQKDQSYTFTTNIHAQKISFSVIILSLYSLPKTGDDHRLIVIRLNR